MSKKDLRPASSESQLERFYKAAHKEVFKIDVYVRPDYHSLFAVMEDDLRSLGITPKDYAYTVVTVLEKWARAKKLDSVPIKIFCGDWALGKARKILESYTVHIEPNNDNEVLLHEELMVARAYLDKNKDGAVVRLGAVVDELTPLLSQGWLELYNKGKKRPIGAVLDILTDELGISQSVRNYSDIVDILRHG